MKEMAKRLTTRDFNQIAELLAAQTWDLDELIKTERKSLTIKGNFSWLLQIRSNFFFI